MWVQKGKLLSRWKERFIVITEEYIQCFKKGLAQLSQMGDFMFQVTTRGCSQMYDSSWSCIIWQIKGRPWITECKSHLSQIG